MGKSDLKVYKNLIYLSQIGINMFVPIFGGVLLGKWLSDRLGGNNLVFLACVILGVMVSFSEFYKFAMKISNVSPNKKERK